tara:strand:+ start:164 stop:682 length:519 start_codon:yes stop_codon:yes gene_type:complete
MSSLRLLNKTTATSVSEISLTDIFTDDFDTYKIVINGAEASTSGAWSHIRLIDENGIVITDSNYQVMLHQLPSYGNATETRRNNYNFAEFIFYTNNTTSGNGVVIYVYLPTNRNAYTFINSESVGQVSTNGPIATKTVAMLEQKAKMTGIKFIRTSGSFDSLDIEVFGIRVD